MLLPLTSIVSPLRTPLIVPAIGASLPFITGETSFGSSRNDFTGSAGFSFVVGASNITVTSLGRWALAGNSQTHQITLYSSTSISSAIATVNVNTNGEPSGNFIYGTVSPVVLTAGGIYYLLSAENLNGDLWYNDSGTSLSTTSAAAIITSCFFVGAGPISPGGGGESYVPPNFEYY